MIDFLFDYYAGKPWIEIVLETIVFFFGIASVWFAGRQNILVFPTGLIATIISVYLLYLAGYLGDLIINVYYSIMSIYGWYNWTKKDINRKVLKISRTNNIEKLIGLGLFFLTTILIFIVYKIDGREIRPENYVDIFTSGLFFTGMYFMALKKIENWILWIVADIISIPLYAYRGLGMLALQFLIFTLLAIKAYIEWRKILDEEKRNLIKDAQG